MEGVSETDAGAKVGGSLTDIKQDGNDTRIGQGRDGEQAKTGLAGASNYSGTTNSGSYQTLGMTIAPIAVYSTVCVSIFWFFRRKFDRVYIPRSFLSSLEEQ